MLNIILPMAGKGSRFIDAGYTIPKPFIPIHNFPMISVVINNLLPKCEYRLILIAQQEHIRKYNLKKIVTSITENVEIIGIEGITDGQVCTALLAKEFFDNDDPVMCANSDQFIDIDINNYLLDMLNRDLDGSIMTMESDDPKWSYAKIDSNGFVIETAEKKVISNLATVGIYCFRKGKEFITAAEEMIADNIRVNNEFYICPVYNYLIRKGKKIGTYSIGKEFQGMYGLGTPSDLEFFLKHPLSEKYRK